MSRNLLHQIQSMGVSVWLDGVSRTQLLSGELARLVTDLGVSGVTTNPTLLAASLADADAYATDLADVRARRLSADEAARLLAAEDVRKACDVLRPVHLQTEKVDGWVSLEVNPDFADDVDATMAEVRALAWMVDRPNLMVKIPATPQGVEAIALATAEGFSINATLIFSAEQYRQVLGAYTRGLQTARTAGLDLTAIHSVASLFVSRVDLALHVRDDDQASATAGDPFALAGVANARRIHSIYEESRETRQWRELRAAGANLQRPLWASTGVKDPDLDPTAYIWSLAIAGTVNTMPLATMLTAAKAPRRVLPRQLTASEVAQLRRAGSRLEAAGDDLLLGLLRDGVAKFQSSWASVLNVLASHCAEPAIT